MVTEENDKDAESAGGKDVMEDVDEEVAIFPSAPAATAGATAPYRRDACEGDRRCYGQQLEQWRQTRKRDASTPICVHVV